MKRSEFRAGKKAIGFDILVLSVAVGLIVTWALDWPVLYVPLAAVLGTAMVFWDHPTTRRLRGLPPLRVKEKQGLSKTPDAIK